MTTLNFTRPHPFTYQAFISFVTKGRRKLLTFILPPVSYASIIPFKLSGQIVYVSKFPLISFPSINLDHAEPPGWYFVDSVILLHSGDFEIGLELVAGTVEYYSLSEIEITDIRTDSSICF